MEVGKRGEDYRKTYKENTRQEKKGRTKELPLAHKLVQIFRFFLGGGGGKVGNNNTTSCGLDPSLCFSAPVFRVKYHSGMLCNIF